MNNNVYPGCPAETGCLIPFEECPHCCDPEVYNEDAHPIIGLGLTDMGRGAFSKRDIHSWPEVIAWYQVTETPPTDAECFEALKAYRVHIEGVTYWPRLSKTGQLPLAAFCNHMCNLSNSSRKEMSDKHMQQILEAGVTNGYVLPESLTLLKQERLYAHRGPNCEFILIKKAGKMELFVLSNRAITAGEELFVNYFGNVQLTPDDAIWHFGTRCGCDLCTHEDTVAKLYAIAQEVAKASKEIAQHLTQSFAQPLVQPIYQGFKGRVRVLQAIEEYFSPLCANPEITTGDKYKAVMQTIFRFEGIECMIVALQDQECIGAVCTSGKIQSRGKIAIDILGFRSLHRSKGIGAELLKHLEQFLLNEISGPFTLRVPPEGHCHRNPIAINAYRLVGWKILKNGKVVEDAVFAEDLETYKNYTESERSKFDCYDHYKVADRSLPDVPNVLNVPDQPDVPNVLNVPDQPDVIELSSNSDSDSAVPVNVILISSDEDV